jgi:hypothetical protein
MRSTGHRHQKREVMSCSLEEPLFCAETPNQTWILQLIYSTWNFHNPLFSDGFPLVSGGYFEFFQETESLRWSQTRPMVSVAPGRWLPLHKCSWRSSLDIKPGLIRRRRGGDGELAMCYSAGFSGPTRLWIHDGIYITDNYYYDLFWSDIEEQGTQGATESVCQSSWRRCFPQVGGTRIYYMGLSRNMIP